MHLGIATRRRRLYVRLVGTVGSVLATSMRVHAQDDSFLSLGRLPYVTQGESFAITAENPTGEKGKGGSSASNLGPTRKGSPATSVAPGKTVVLADIKGAGCIKHIWITVPPPPREWRTGSNLWRDLVIRMYWDGAKNPCVEAPLGDFFGLGQGARVPINSAMISVAEGRGLNCYWPMPFAKSARIEIEHQGTEDFGQRLFYQIDFERLKKLDRRAARFHAQWRRENPTVLKKDYTILEAEGRGHYVGTTLSLVPLTGNWWGEGEVKFYIDTDRDLPTIAGTGAEDYFGSAWGLSEFSALYHGAPLEEKGRASMYRWHVQDPVRFKKDLRVTIQVIGWRDGLFERSDDICSTAYWYQEEPHKPFPALPAVVERRPREPVIK